MATSNDLFQKYNMSLSLDTGTPHRDSVEVTSEKQLEEALAARPELFHGFKAHLIVNTNQGNGDWIYLDYTNGKLCFRDEVPAELVLQASVTHMLKYMMATFDSKLVPNEGNRPLFTLEERVEYSSANGLFTNVKSDNFEVVSIKDRGLVAGRWVTEYLIKTPAVVINRFEKQMSFPYAIRVSYSPYCSDLKIESEAEQVRELEALGVVVKFFGKIKLK